MAMASQHGTRVTSTWKARAIRPCLRVKLNDVVAPSDGDAHTEKGEAGGGGGSIKGDETNILVLLFLYILQGIPLGLAAAIPLILTNRNVRYRSSGSTTWNCYTVIDLLKFSEQNSAHSKKLNFFHQPFGSEWIRIMGGLPDPYREYGPGCRK